MSPIESEMECLAKLDWQYHLWKDIKDYIERKDFVSAYQSIYHYSNKFEDEQTFKKEAIIIAKEIIHQLENK